MEHDLLLPVREELGLWIRGIVAERFNRSLSAPLDRHIRRSQSSQKDAASNARGDLLGSVEAEELLRRVRFAKHHDRRRGLAAAEPADEVANLSKRCTPTTGTPPLLRHASLVELRGALLKCHLLHGLQGGRRRFVDDLEGRDDVHHRNQKDAGPSYQSAGVDVHRLRLGDGRGRRVFGRDVDDDGSLGRDDDDDRVLGRVGRGDDQALGRDYRDRSLNRRRRLAFQERGAEAPLPGGVLREEASDEELVVLEGDGELRARADEASGDRENRERTLEETRSWA